MNNSFYFSCLQRMFRGIPADVWVAETSSHDNATNYQTTELYFSQEEWKVLENEATTSAHHQTSPLGMATFIAPATSVRMARVCQSRNDVHQVYYSLSIQNDAASSQSIF